MSPTSQPGPGSTQSPLELGTRCPLHPRSLSCLTCRPVQVGDSWMRQITPAHICGQTAPHESKQNENPKRLLSTCAVFQKMSAFYTTLSGDWRPSDGRVTYRAREATTRYERM